jgi:hypothetical protein
VPFEDIVDGGVVQVSAVVPLQEERRAVLAERGFQLACLYDPVYTIPGDY